MLAFHFPERLWALLLMPVLAVLFYGYRRWQRARLQRLADTPLQAGLWTEQTPPRSRAWLAALPLMAVALLALAAAGLYEPKGEAGKPSKGVDVMLVLDASRSMRARDVQPSRLDRALSFLSRLADRLEGDRVGLVVFAGRPYLQTPLTTDRGALRLSLQSVSPEALPTQGTLLSPALMMAARSFPQNLRRSRVVVLVSDGEDHDKSAADVADLFRQQGVQLMALGVGTPEGAGLLEADGTPKTSSNGERVITRLEETSLQGVARQTSGSYSRLQDAVTDADRVANAIKSLPSSYLPAAKGEEPAAREYFPIFAGVALALLVLYSLLQPVRRRPKLTKALSVLVILMSISLAAQAQSDWQKGTQWYREGKFGQAAEAFQKALGDSASRAAAQYNLGNALYKKGDFAAAAKAYEQAAQQSGNPDAAYNLGNSYAAQKQWQQAMNAYKKALQEKPGTVDAQRNYAYARKQLQRQQQEQQQQEEQQKNQSQPQQQEDAKPNPSNLTKEQAEKMLQALRQEEQKIKGRKQDGQDAPTPPEKDW